MLLSKRKKIRGERLLHLFCNRTSMIHWASAWQQLLPRAFICSSRGAQSTGHYFALHTSFHVMKRSHNKISSKPGLSYAPTPKPNGFSYYLNKSGVLSLSPYAHMWALVSGWAADGISLLLEVVILQHQSLEKTGPEERLQRKSRRENGFLIKPHLMLTFHQNFL